VKVIDEHIEKGLDEAEAELVELSNFPRLRRVTPIA